MIKDNLIVRSYKNRDKNQNSSGTKDYWIYNTDSGALICVYVDLSDKFDSEYILRMYKKESKEAAKSIVVSTATEERKAQQTAKPTSKKLMPAEISKFFE